MKKLFIVFLAGVILACNNDAEGTGDSDTLNTTDTANRVRDPNEGITDSTKILNDSVIVPDTGNRNPDPSKVNNDQ